MEPKGNSHVARHAIAKHFPLSSTVLGAMGRNMLQWLPDNHNQHKQLAYELIGFRFRIDRVDLGLFGRDWKFISPRSRDSMTGV